ncbi:MAG: hypothetical protein R3E86_13935 [Pseudomonadales bacterium]
MRGCGFLALAVLMLLLGGCGAPTTSERNEGAAADHGGVQLLAGASSTIVSPAPGAFIAGDARNRRFTGEHDPLFARAVVVSDGASAVALVTVDNIGLVHPDIDAIRRRAAELAAALAPHTGLPAERIVVSSTHSHSGPDVVGLWGADELTSGRDPVYMARLIESTAQQVAAAAAMLRPVTMRVASGEPSLDWVHNVTEPGLLDREMTVAQFVDGNGTTVATLTNFACHPTVMDAVSDQISSDYVAGFYRMMGEVLPGEHLFLQGAIGGWVQPDKTGRSFALADRYGADVARAALSLLAQAEQESDPGIRFASRQFDIPLHNPGFAALLDAGVVQRPRYDGAIRTESAWFAIGETQFVTHPGETSPAYSLQSRARMSARHSFVLGLGLDALGYILKPDYFAADASYPSREYLTATSVGPEAAPRLMRTLEALIPR